jgi:hypothetical protein
MEGRRMNQGKFDYLIGKRIEMIHCTDQYSPIPQGTQGTVDMVDDMGTVFVDWDNGSTLGLIMGEDKFKIVD